MSMLNRWVRQKQDLGAEQRKKDQKFQKIPHNVEECTNIFEAELYRKRIIGGVIKRVSQIQNASLSNDKIKELNDEINNILKTKYKWEARIKKLGGPDYQAELDKQQTLSIESGGKKHGEYLYFGAAKNLPNVQEIFLKDIPQAPVIAKTQLARVMNDATYWGTDSDQKQIKDDLEIEEYLLKTA